MMVMTVMVVMMVMMMTMIKLPLQQDCACYCEGLLL